MISDVLLKSAKDIRGYLEDSSVSGVYAGVLRERIERLVQELDAVRMLPGMPADIEDKSEKLNKLETKTAMGSRQLRRSDRLDFYLKQLDKDVLDGTITRVEQGKIYGTLEETFLMTQDEQET